MSRVAQPSGPYAEIVGATEALACHVADTQYENLPASVVHAFKRALMDYLACAIAGGAMPVSQALLSYFEEEDASRAAAVIGKAARLSAANAALVNGAHAHGLDFDDGYTQGSAHPAGAIFPAALAAAERHGASAHSIITAVVLGYDVMLRVAATVHPTTARKGFHNTAIAGVFGAAAAVSSILRLDAPRTRDALGLAASFAGGVREYLAEGAEVKRLHPGKAARDGLLCAELARRGVTGPSKGLEGAMGFLRLFAGEEIRSQHLLADLGTRWCIEDVYFKPYPCCRHYHAAIDAVLELRAQQAIDPDDVTGITIGLYGVGTLGHDHTTVETLLEAQMSAPCAIALGLADGDVTAVQFLSESVSRPIVRSLMAMSRTTVDAQCERIYPGVRSGVVTLDLRDKRQLVARVENPKGEAQNPMTDADLERKFQSNARPVVGEAVCGQIAKSVWQFDQLTHGASLYRW